MLRILAILLLAFNLSGCLLFGAFVVGAAAGGAIIYDQRSIKEQFADKKIGQIANNRLDQDKELRDRSHISVTAFHHVVLIVGQVQTPELKDRAYQIVSTVPNVKRIYNELVVSGDTTYVVRTDDDWITTKIKAHMVGTSGLRSSDIKVVTEDGIVYLMGRVTHRQAQIATDVARKVSGVRKVVKVFEYAT